MSTQSIELTLSSEQHIRCPHRRAAHDRTLPMCDIDQGRCAIGPSWQHNGKI
jgi:hypothetical protein